MKKSNFLSKATISLIAISMTMGLFVGCQSSSSNNSTSQTSSSSTQNSNKPNAEQMKTRIQDSIKPLVTAGTITQAQADKIVEAYTTRPTGNGQNKPQDKQQSNQSNQSGSNANNGQNGQNRQRYNPLSKLVSDGTITQAQADAVMQKIRENSPNKNSGQSSQSSTSQSSK